MSEKIELSEERDREIIDGWYRRAKELKTPGELNEFLCFMLTEYQHDYGTIVHACTAAALGSVHVMDRDPDSGGLTGFQASCIMWGFISKFMHLENKPLRLLEFEHLLYPQYDDRFRTISKETWKWLQDEATKRLVETPNAAPEVVGRWKAIVDGALPAGLVVDSDE
jgi:hypothetical protein